MITLNTIENLEEAILYLRRDTPNIRLSIFKISQSLGDLKDAFKMVDCQKNGRNITEHFNPQN